MADLVETFAGATPGVTETWRVDDGGNIHVSKQQDCKGILEATHALGDMKGRDDGLRYCGSVPLVLANVWARECGAAIGTAEFARYAKKKLQDADNRRLLVNRF